MNKSQADLSLRLVNYGIDNLLILLIYTPISSVMLILSDDYNSNTGLLSVYTVVQFLYYFIFELSSGQTIGKKITKTKVVTINGKLNFFKILVRTLTRIIPIDRLSYLFGHTTGMHDQYSGTYVISLNSEE